MREKHIVSHIKGITASHHAAVGRRDICTVGAALCTLLCIIFIACFAAVHSMDGGTPHFYCSIGSKARTVLVQ